MGDDPVLFDLENFLCALRVLGGESISVFVTFPGGFYGSKEFLSPKGIRTGYGSH
jgi:hypothetical protein